MKKKFFHPLMYNNFIKSDYESLRKFLKKKQILTQSINVKHFEKKWSEWLGVKYSVFVNSGSSANYISISTLKILKQKNNKKNEIIVPTLTWISDVVSVINNGFKPIFTDINHANLSIDENEIYSKCNKNTLAVFLTHAQGFNGLSDKLINFLRKKKIILLEDVCESHGATYKNKKLGTFGLISNFSFYYAHHLSTIEGGMICTNNKKIYEIARMLRSHGMIRESDNVNYEKKMIKKHSDLSPKFIFPYAGFNMRSTELSAVLGLNQLKRLDKNNKRRRYNFEIFLKNLDKNIFFTDFQIEGNSNYAFPIILKKKNFLFRAKFENLLKKNNIEFRRGNAGGGNQMRQPYIQNYIKNQKLIKFPNVEHVHFFGYYIGNYPSLSKTKIIKICKILNSIKDN